MNLFEKIAAIMQDVQYMAKDDQVSFGNTKYKALSEEKVTGIMRAELIKHRVMVYPVRQSSSRSGQITHVDVVYRMVNVDDPEDFIEIASCGDGADTQDKGSGKAMTYAFKYMWLRTFAIPTGEDPDKISSAELDEKMKYICADCGKPIETIIKTDGEPWAPPDIVAYSNYRFHRDLCGPCQKAAAKAEKAKEKEAQYVGA